jgi:hypothetical protein
LRYHVRPQPKRWQAELNHQIALANYFAISIDREVLWGNAEGIQETCTLL